MAVYRIAILFALVATCYSLNSWEIPDGNLQDHVTPDLDADWFIFKKNYNRTYNDRNEDLTRRLIWEDNIRFIDNHNRKYERGESTFSLGENHFADLAEDEFTKLYLSGLVIPDDYKHQNDSTDEEVDVSDVGAPAQIDWRAKGAVTAVRNQGSCGSCWAFAAIGAMESAYLKNFRQRKDLSEQQLVDCANSRWGNYGCRGGWMANAYKYIESFGGIANENCYRYTQRDGYCRANRRCIGGRLSTHRAVSRSEPALKKAVADHGPVAIAADVSGRTFGFYRSGVFNNPGCTQRPNHAMVAVGYGRYYGRDYWLIKNSWGVRWGDQGYIKMSRNAGNQCAIASYAVYPVVK